MIEDDYDGELRYDRRPVGALQGTAPDHVAYVGTASKILGPGIRLGWSVLPDGWVDDVRRAQDVATQGLDVTSQLTFAAFLESYAYDRLVRSRRATYRRRVAELVSALDAGGPFATSGIAAGGHLLVSLPGRGRRRAGGRPRGRATRPVPGRSRRPAARPAAYPPAIVLGYTRPSAFAWPPLLSRFVELLQTWCTDPRVRDYLMERVPATLAVALGGATCFLVLGVGIGIVAARRRGTTSDKAIIGTSLFVDATPRTCSSCSPGSTSCGASAGSPTPATTRRSRTVRSSS